MSSGNLSILKVGMNVCVCVSDKSVYLCVCVYMHMCVYTHVRTKGLLLEGKVGLEG